MLSNGWVSRIHGPRTHCDFHCCLERPTPPRPSTCTANQIRTALMRLHRGSARRRGCSTGPSCILLSSRIRRLLPSIACAQNRVFLHMRNRPAPSSHTRNPIVLFSRAACLLFAKLSDGSSYPLQYNLTIRPSPAALKTMPSGISSLVSTLWCWMRYRLGVLQSCSHYGPPSV